MTSRLWLGALVRWAVVLSCLGCGPGEDDVLDWPEPPGTWVEDAPELDEYDVSARGEDVEPGEDPELPTPMPKAAERPGVMIVERLEDEPAVGEPSAAEPMPPARRFMRQLCERAWAAE
ncbi:MAG: hypothetical protein ACOZQL_08615 [Myxococcota bacterium]